MRFFLLTILIIALPPVARSSGGQTVGAKQEKKNAAKDELVKQQAFLTKQVELLDSKLLKLVQHERDLNPERSDLLKQSLELSQSLELATNLKTITELLKRGGTADLDLAVEKQNKILSDLNRLYELLESNDRLKSQRNRAKKIRSRINRVEQLIQKQKGIRQRTGSTDFSDLKTDQLRVVEQTRDLKTEMGKEIKNEKDSQSKPNGDQPETKSGDASAEPDKTEDVEKTGSADKSTSSSDEERAFGNIRSASNNMQKAAENLNPQEHEQAAMEMEAAEKDLELAKKSLEESLRLNREEEINSTLRSLEERLGRMLRMQVKVNSETQEITKSKTPASELRISSFRLSGEQRKAIVEVDKALLMLTEEGSSRSIPGTLYHIKLDMQSIASKLELAKIDTEVLELQSDVVEVLSELIRAVKQEQLEQNQLKKLAQQPAGGGGQKMERPLVQKIAELKIIRQLQVRINSRHQSYAKAISESNDQARNKELNEKTKKLSLRQKQLEKTTLDLIQAAGQQ